MFQYINSILIIMLNKLAHNIMKLFNSQNKNTPPVINTVVAVNQLSAFDMIYVYHLISIGTKVKLYKTSTNLNGDYIYAVFYKSYQLGTVKITGLRKRLIPKESEIDAIVSGLSKEKYLPLKSLEITLNSSKNLKLVG